MGSMWIIRGGVDHIGAHKPYLHSPADSSHSILLRFCFVMPFSCANACHLVKRTVGSCTGRHRTTWIGTIINQVYDSTPSDVSNETRTRSSPGGGLEEALFRGVTSA
eukprot:6399815-Pyramimonas_sp.AAC.1